MKVLLLVVAFVSADVAIIDEVDTSGNLTEASIDLRSSVVKGPEAINSALRLPSHDFGFSCWKVCALFATRSGKASMTVDEQHLCCRRVHQFETNLRTNPSILVSIGSTTQRDVPPLPQEIKQLSPSFPWHEKFDLPAKGAPAAGEGGSGLINIKTRIVEKSEKNAEKKRTADSLLPIPTPMLIPSPVPTIIDSEPLSTPSASPQLPPPETSAAPQPVLPALGTAPPPLMMAHSNKGLLIAIETAPHHFDERLAIRDTWMNYIRSDTTFMPAWRREQTDILFFIGEISQVPKDNTTDPTVLSKRITQEMTIYKDIMRLDDFVEDYSNLTLKTISLMRWANERNYGAVFKTDDDSFVCVDKLWDSFTAIQKRDTAYISHCSFEFPVNQDPESKNYMADSYPHETIPMLCHGGGYLLGKDLVSYVARNAENLTFHRNEDVAISLWLTGPDAHVSQVNLEPNLPVTFFWEECNPTSVYLNPMRLDDMYTVWNNILKPSSNICANNFQLREFLDLLDQLQEEERQSMMGEKK